MSKEQFNSPSIIPTQFNNKITSNMIIRDNSFSINFKLDGINYHIWFKKFKKYILKKITLFVKKLPPKKTIPLKTNGKMKIL